MVDVVATKTISKHWRNATACVFVSLIKNIQLTLEMCDEEAISKPGIQTSFCRQQNKDIQFIFTEAQINKNKI